MKELEQAESALLAAEQSLERERGIVQSLASRGQRAVEQAQEAKDRAGYADKAATLLNQFSDEKQDEVVAIIEAITSEGLSEVFGESIELTITKEIKARRTEMVVKVRTGDLETSIMDARGGGLAAVAGFLLRACVILLTPGARRALFLDEVFAHLSEDYVPRMAEFLRELCERTGLQILLVTHQPEFAEAAPKVYRIEKTGPNTSRFVEET